MGEVIFNSTRHPYNPYPASQIMPRLFGPKLGEIDEHGPRARWAGTTFHIDSCYPSRHALSNRLRTSLLVGMGYLPSGAYCQGHHHRGRARLETRDFLKSNRESGGTQTLRSGGGLLAGPGFRGSRRLNAVGDAGDGEDSSLPS